MHPTSTTSLSSFLHATLALATGVLICMCAVLLLFDRPSELFGTGRWIDGPATKYTLGLLTAAASAGSVFYLNRSAVLVKRTRIILVGAAPGLIVALWVFFAIALLMKPIGF